jgi:hypothetical protein
VNRAVFEGEREREREREKGRFEDGCIEAKRL